MGLGEKKDTAFQHHVQGTWGKFATPAGRVDYLLTKARLGPDSTDPERRLTQHLAPVREVLQSDDLDFNQLLQRDLDDHRVAVNLVPYLLSHHATGPAFFPPIVAVLLPFQDKRPSEFAPLVARPDPIRDEDLCWRQQDAGEQARFRQLLYNDGTPHEIKLAQMWWNPEFARLVVLDGQHRAMALLAIDRTVRKSWSSSPGEKYKYFYESRVQELLAGNSIDLEGIEVPVAVTWMPELFGPGKSPHVAARKLFVDVNKEARKPSESRLILLSDSELLNVFTRSLLSRLRNQGDSLLPLYSVEYDNPDPKTTQSARWSAMTNIHILQQMTKRLIFGPNKYLVNLSARMGARDPLAEMDSLMRAQLDITTPFKGVGIPLSVEEDGVTFLREKLGNVDFPLGQKDILAERFVDSWGALILNLLSEIKPYRAHAEALTSIKEAWISSDAIDGLAHDAMFGGVGMYWTLRSSAEHFKQESSTGVKVSGPIPDTVKAWRLLDKKQSDFEVQRAIAYSGNSGKETLEITNAAYSMFNTQASQVGLALTVGSLQRLGAFTDASLDELPSLGSKLAEGINAWLDLGSGKYQHRFFLNRAGMRWPINLIAKLDAPRAVEFRYLWLEVLASQASLTVLAGLIDVEKLLTLRDTARAHYLDFIIDQQASALRHSQPAWSDDKRIKNATEQMTKSLAKGLELWFDVSRDQFDEWQEIAASTPVPDDDETQDESQVEANGLEEGEDDVALDEPAGSPGLDEFLAGGD